MWQTKYASAISINLGLGFDFQPCSEGDFLIGPPKSVLYAMLNSEREFLMLCPFNFVRFFYKILIQKRKKEIRKVHKFNLVEQFFIDLLVAVMISEFELKTFSIQLTDPKWSKSGEKIIAYQSLWITAFTLDFIQFARFLWPIQKDEGKCILNLSWPK